MDVLREYKDAVHASGRDPGVLDLLIVCIMEPGLWTY